MKVFRLLAFLALIIGLPTCGLAQDAATLAAFAKGPHTGPVDAAIVGVTTRFHDHHGDTLEERHGCGMMLRSDGFVLFSAALLDHRTDEPDDVRPAIDIVLQPGGPGERTVTAPWPKAIPSGLSLRMVKLSDTHSPALRTLLPDLLKPGDALGVVWLPWDEAAHRFGPIQQRLVHLSAPPARARIDPWIATTAESLDGVASGAIVVGPEGMAVGVVTARAGDDPHRFTTMEALAKVTNCVTPVPVSDVEFAARSKSDAADGAGAAPPPAAGDPAPPDPAAADGGQAPADGSAAGDEPAGGKSAMVKVPGGPVALPKAIRETQIEMGSSAVACVAPFQIDRYEVTNQEYWEFWSALPSKTSADMAFRRLAWPAGWSGSGAPFTGALARVPVLGVSLAGAQAYARSRGKRLPTPYEWALAALGPAGDAKGPEWIAQLIADKNDVALRIKKTHLAFLQQLPEIHGEDFLLHSTRLHSLTLTKVKVGRSWVTVSADQRIHGSDFMPGLPWVISPLLGFAPELQGGNGFFDAFEGVPGLDIPIRLKMQQWSRQQIDAQTQTLWDRWKAPLAILPVGSRSFDVGPYGAADMILNGPELVAPPATAPSGLDGFAVSVTLTHPQDPKVLNEQLLVSGPNPTGLVETYGGTVAYPLSRLVERSPGFPVAQWLWFQNNLEETRAAMRLVSGWQVNMLAAAATVEIRTDNHSPFVGPVFYDNYPLYRDWVRPSNHTRIEIGSAIPLPAEEPLPTRLVPQDTGATLRFLIPIGFRCAR